MLIIRIQPGRLGSQSDCDSCPPLPLPSIVYIIIDERLKWSNIIMMMYIVCKPIDIRISSGFGFGATFMSIDIFINKAR
jgi:hypothetical protein